MARSNKWMGSFKAPVAGTAAPTAPAAAAVAPKAPAPAAAVAAPKPPAAVAAAPKPPSGEAANLARWRASGKPRDWVAARKGQWNHDEWLKLLEELKRSEYWPMQLAAIGETLEALKR